MSLFAEAQPPALPLPRKILTASAVILLPTDGSAGAPLITKAGLGWAKIACHVNSVDVLVERFEILLLATPLWTSSRELVPLP